MSDLHTWVVWEKNWPRSSWSLGEPYWKVISSHKTRVAAEIAVKRGFGRRVIRRNSHGRLA